MGSAVAQATELDFEALNPGSVPAGYGNLTWDNWGLMPKSTCQDGYCASVTSGSWSVFNQSGDDATITSTALFDFQGAYLAGAFHDDLLVNVKGYANGQLAHERTVGVNTVIAQWFDFGFTGVDSLVFSSFGPSVQSGVSSQGSNFGMDDFTFERAVAVTEPSTIGLLGAGMALLVGVRRKRADCRG
ncbi:PEP-CTERM sorting domain-containing protein [Marinobacter salicampi]|uniref:PEP-CTERM sorting domain-containing protein n=1 Tax=Marinobacter salicampi TaxID=435907 RepID=UPI001407F783|nr:PEP-CTERM sorting domain-containing protein [Marinobacter salicampi]